MGRREPIFLAAFTIKFIKKRGWSSCRGTVGWASLLRQGTGSIPCQAEWVRIQHCGSSLTTDWGLPYSGWPKKKKKKLRGALNRDWRSSCCPVHLISCYPGRLVPSLVNKGGLITLSKKNPWCMKWAGRNDLEKPSNTSIACLKAYHPRPRAKPSHRLWFIAA